MTVTSGLAGEAPFLGPVPRLLRRLHPQHREVMPQRADISALFPRLVGTEPGDGCNEWQRLHECVMRAPSAALRGDTDD